MTDSQSRTLVVAVICAGIIFALMSLNKFIISQIDTATKITAVAPAAPTKTSAPSEMNNPYGVARLPVIDPQNDPLAPMVKNDPPQEPTTAPTSAKPVKTYEPSKGPDDGILLQ